MNDLIERKCNGCDETKAIAEFSVDRSRRSGFKYTCRLCAHAARRAASFRNNYGITISQYEEMVMAQCGLCAVCNEPETATLKKTGDTKRLAVHHNHDSGEVVALLCQNCNIGMGNLRDNPTYLRRAAQLMEEMV